MEEFCVLKKKNAQRNQLQLNCKDPMGVVYEETPHGLPGSTFFYLSDDIRLNP